MRCACSNCTVTIPWDGVLIHIYQNNKAVLDKERSTRIDAWLLQALHRNHAAPSGAFITGDPSVGFTLHLRAKDASAAEVNKMRRFTDLCNAGASVIARGAQAHTLLGQSQIQDPPQAAGSKYLCCLLFVMPESQPLICHCCCNGIGVSLVTCMQPVTIGLELITHCVQILSLLCIPNELWNVMIT